MPVYVIEHLEPRIWKWCLIEYKHISKIVGRNNLWFTNVRKGSKELEMYGKVIKGPVSSLNLNNACVLDPEAEKILTSNEAKKFDYFIFGGILGDNPPQKRTADELTSKLKAEARNIGKGQMSTDNVVYVVKEIISGRDIKDLSFKDRIEIQTGEYDSVVLPYRYILVDGKPLVSGELITFLKRKKGF